MVRIGGYDGKWELVERIRIPDEVPSPWIRGCISDNKIIIPNFKTYLRGKGHCCMLDIDNKTIQEVITDAGSKTVFLNVDTVVCGMLEIMPNGASLEDCIRLYDRRWNVFSNITIPHNKHDKVINSTFVDVLVDRDGKIIAAERHQTNIYVINPSDGEIVKTITCKGKLILRGVLSSGQFVAHPSPHDNKIPIIDREGSQKEIALDRTATSCTIDPLTDDLYPVYWDKTRKACVVDHLSSTGELKATNVLN